MTKVKHSTKQIHEISGFLLGNDQIFTKFLLKGSQMLSFVWKTAKFPKNPNVMLANIQIWPLLVQEYRSLEEFLMRAWSLKPLMQKSSIFPTKLYHCNQT